ncbi:anaerobic ribonucleoside-triphosphate reductase activating protein [candidate division KSB1 bacterium]|nr:anaerobic ribonucleoside-triphosphate reductase activating protein [candidate division KSB1 bacterium]
MKIAGLQKFSLIDYPGKISAVVFTRGCNFRCPFCHNPELVLPESYAELYPPEKIFQFFDKRRNQLDGIVITGGEPTLQDDLIDFVKEIKKFGYLVKLDTNGSKPDVLEQMICEKLLDYISMDIKAPFDKYDLVCGVKSNPENIQKSIDVIKKSDIVHTFRTTVVKQFLDYSDLIAIRELVGDNQKYVLQNFNKSGKILNSKLKEIEQYTDMEISNFQKFISEKDTIPHIQ